MTGRRRGSGMDWHRRSLSGSDASESEARTSQTLAVLFLLLTSFLNQARGEIVELKYRGSWIGSSEVQDVCVVTNRAYVADGGSLVVLDVSDPALPVQLGSRNTPGVASSVVVSGVHAFVACATAGLQVFNVANPSNIVLVSSFVTNVGGWFPPAYGVDVASNHAYVAYANAGLQVLDITDPTNLVWRSAYTNKVTEADGVHVIGGVAYVASSKLVPFNESGMVLVDVSNPSSPSTIGVWTNVTPGIPVNVWVAGRFAYISCIGIFGGSFPQPIVDISNPEKPITRGSYSVDCTLPGRLQSMNYFGNDFLLTAGQSSGLHVIDVHDPDNPVEVFAYKTAGHSVGVRISGNLAYVADGPNGLVILELDLAPSVALSNPVRDEIFLAPATIPLMAQASDKDDAVAQVAFYESTNLLTIVTNPPYSLTWSNVPLGLYELTARAVDERGVWATSAPVAITVTNIAVFQLSETNYTVNESNAV